MEEATAEEGPMAPYSKVNTVLLFLLSLQSNKQGWGSEVNED